MKPGRIIIDIDIDVVLMIDTGGLVCVYSKIIHPAHPLYMSHSSYA